MCKEKYTFKRYMIFEWDEYDNADPFNCIVESFDNLEDATDLFKRRKVYGKCIFDRVDGCVVLEEEPETLY